jgi:anionic cell wall polymer biosynthesis LytR-Cps2A-Psr (LCP) family protein
MFDQLDDPAGFRPGADFRARVRRRTHQLHRRRRARRAAAVAALPVSALVGVAAVVDRRLDGVQRVDIGNNEVGRDPLETGRPVTILVLGTDAAPDDPTRTEVTGVRDDVILVVRIDGGRISTLSIPRDLWTGSVRIAELDAGQMVEWLDAELGIHVDHLVSMDMPGFARLADRVRPRVHLDLPVRDRGSGLDLPAGCTTLDGEQALTYVRARHLQEENGGSWHIDPSSDAGRIARTQSLVAAAWSQLRRLDAGDLPALVALLADHATLDAGTSTTDLLRLARRVQSADAAPSTATLPTVPADAGDGQVVTSLTGGDALTSAVAAVGGRPAATLHTLPQIYPPVPYVPMDPHGLVTPC